MYRPKTIPMLFGYVSSLITALGLTYVAEVGDLPVAQRSRDSNGWQMIAEDAVSAYNRVKEDGPMIYRVIDGQNNLSLTDQSIGEELGIAGELSLSLLLLSMTATASSGLIKKVNGKIL